MPSMRLFPNFATDLTTRIFWAADSRQTYSLAFSARCCGCAFVPTTDSIHFGHLIDQLVECHWIVPDPHAGCVVDRVSDRRRDAAETEFSDTLGLHWG